MREIMTGLEYMRRIQRGEIQSGPMVRLLGMRFTEVEEGRVTLTAEMKHDLENGLGIAHGGFAATLLDSALGSAVNTVMPAGKVFTTLEMKIHYVRAIQRDAGTLTCTAHVVHAGSRTATSEGRIVDAKGTLYAHGTATCILFKELMESSPSPPTGEKVAEGRMRGSASPESQPVTRSAATLSPRPRGEGDTEES